MRQANLKMKCSNDNTISLWVSTKRIYNNLTAAQIRYAASINDNYPEMTVSQKGKLFMCYVSANVFELYAK